MMTSHAIDYPDRCVAHSSESPFRVEEESESTEVRVEVALPKHLPDKLWPIHESCEWL